MAKVLSVEIGASLIRLCEVDYKEKSPKVYKWATIQTPEGAVVDDAVVVDDGLITAIKATLREKHMSAKKLVFAMNSTKIASREVVIPFVKENKVGEIIQANASDFFPVDLEQYELGHTIIGTTENDKGVKQYKVHVLAAPKAIIESYKELAKALGGSVEALDYSGNSVYQMVKNHCAAGVQMVVKIDEKSSIITILKNQAIVLQRTISYGVEDAISAVMNSSYYNEVSYLQAVQTLKEQNCFEDEYEIGEDEILDMDGDYGVSQTMLEEVGSSLNYLVNGISRVVDYYNSRNSESPIEQAYVTGLGGDCKGIDGFLTRALDTNVQVLRELEGFKLEKYFKNESFGPYLTCIGAAMAPLGFMGQKAEKAKKMDVVPDQGNMKTTSILVLLGGVVIAAVLAVVSNMQLSEAQEENWRLQDRITELQPVKEVYQAYLQQQYTTTKLNFFYNSTVLPNENLVEFIEEMEQKMPSSLNVQSFITSTDGVTMALTVADKKEAAKLIQQFRTFDSISEVAVSGISDTGAVMEGEPIEQEGKVTFSITLTYKGADELAAEQMAEQAAEEAVAAETQE